MPVFSDSRQALTWLRTPAAVRERAHALLEKADAGALAHFGFDRSRLDPAADCVIDVIRADYPDLDIPFHSRWRHIAAGGVDRWARLAEQLPAADHAEIARVRIDLAVTSVLLDAGAGPHWRYRDSDGETYARSEGLAVASVDLFAAGAFSDDAATPLRADAAALSRFAPETLAASFQVDGENPLTGLAGRAALLRRLGETLVEQPLYFGGAAPRIGNLFDYFAGIAGDGAIAAPAILQAVLYGLGPIWPGRLTLAGVNLGDVWKHPALRTDDATNGLIPFHKLSQWLSYSLIEPLQDAGLVVTDLDALTGLAEYRNGGLMLDMHILQPLHDEVLKGRHAVDSEIVVEWRALTVAALDLLAATIRQKLGMDEETLPLAKVLQGGTWSAGRGIAAERRADGGPPIQVISDGTVF